MSFTAKRAGSKAGIPRGRRREGGVPSRSFAAQEILPEPVSARSLLCGRGCERDLRVPAPGESAPCLSSGVKSQWSACAPEGGAAAPPDPLVISGFWSRGFRGGRRVWAGKGLARVGKAPGRRTELISTNSIHCAPRGCESMRGSCPVLSDLSHCGFRPRFDSARWWVCPVRPMLNC